MSKTHQDHEGVEGGHLLKLDTDILFITKHLFPYKNSIAIYNECTLNIY